MSKEVCIRIIDTSRVDEDTNKSLHLVDELSAAALGLISGGPMAYTQFIQLRDEFKHHITGVANSYKTFRIE